MSPYDSTLALADDPAMASPDGNGDMIVLKTRFGTFEVDPAKTIEMPQGPIGFTDHRHFALLDLEGEQETPFKLFQSLDDNALTFVVLPVQAEDPAIEPEDRAAACDAYGVPAERAAFMVIATVRKNASGGVETTVNLRAPLLIDTQTLAARQVVFSGERYPMRQPLSQR